MKKTIKELMNEVAIKYGYNNYSHYESIPDEMKKIPMEDFDYEVERLVLKQIAVSAK